MKFVGFREYRPITKDAEEITKYLSVDLIYSLRELKVVLSQLGLTENFESFRADVTIPAGSELAIRNKIPSVPTSRIIVRSNGYEIADGDTPWDHDYVYMKNLGAGDITASIIFLK